MIVVVGWLMLLLATSANVAMSSQTNNQSQCIPKEKESLLSFKLTLNDTQDYLSSWTTNSSADQNCCNWHSITCDNQTNHVVSIDVSGIHTVGGELDSSFAELQYLNYLDLSSMNINRIPKFIGSLKELTYLDLWDNPFEGVIPPQFGNLTKLQSLRLSSTSWISVDNQKWHSHLTSLETLHLSGVNFTGAGLQSLTAYSPFLSSLFMSSCLLPKVDNSVLFRTNHSFNSLTSLELFNNSIHPTAITFLLNCTVHLSTLSLLYNTISGSFPNSFEQAKSLQIVDLSRNDVGSGVPKSLGNLTNLEELDLSFNNLGGTLHDLLQNLTGSTKNSLKILQLEYNQLGGLILEDFENVFPSLIELYLNNNHLEGSFPSGLKRYPGLKILSLDENNLTGILPDLSSMPNLTSFGASNNKFNGISSESIGKLDYLETLNISSNSLSGIISEVNLQCALLKTLNLSHNSALKLNFNSNWVPSFQLQSIYLSSCNLGPKFPSWLQTQKDLSYLDISNSNISGPVPSWFTNITANLNHLNMSLNNLGNTLPDFSLSSTQNTVVDLSFNQFQGSVPPSLALSATHLFLSNNKFTKCPHFLREDLESLRANLKSRRANLIFPCIKCRKKKNEKRKTAVIDLSYNYLSGNLPDYWDIFSDLVVLNLGYNMLSGNIPSSIGNIRNISTLQLRHNNFSGNLPSSLKDNDSLKVLDLANNFLKGTIPPWIGEKGTLVFLSLRSNKFYGSIPLSLCHLTQIKILDLSLNDLSGAIPSCIQNFTTMVMIMDHEATISSTIIQTMPTMDTFQVYTRNGASNSYSRDTTRTIGLFHNTLSITWKGVDHEYDTILGLLRIIDLSSNKLSGEIPIEVANLSQMIQLNLSRNNLSGRIPEKIGSLTKLQVLDFSHNRLCGPIPISLAKVSFLSYLDLSNNQLSGRIPTGVQLQTFNASTYSTNLGLCGPPLSSSCPGDEILLDPSNSTYDNEGDDEDGGEWLDLPWLYKGAGVGFVIGFCGICGNLWLNTSWKLSYFKLMHDIGDWLYVIIIVNWTLLRRKLSLQ